MSEASWPVELQVATREPLRRILDIELAAESPDYVFSGDNLAVLTELRAKVEPQ